MDDVAVGAGSHIKAFDDARMLGMMTPVLYGQSKAFSYYKKNFGLDSFNYSLTRDARQAWGQKFNIVNIVDKELKIDPGMVTEVSTEMDIMSMKRASEDLRVGYLDAVVMAPSSPSLCQTHKEFLSSLFQAADTMQVLVSGMMKMALLTDPMPLQKALPLLTKDYVVGKLALLSSAMKKDFMLASPKMAVLGIDPEGFSEGANHIVAEAVEMAQEKGLLAFGPFTSPTEQMTVNNGSSASYTRELASNSTISLTWHNGSWTEECSFEITYEDGSVIYQNSGGFSGTQTFTINCAGGSGAPEFCAPIRNLTYELDGNDVVLAWDAPESGTPAWYEVYRDTELLDLVEGLTFTDANVAEGLYNYCVYAAYDGCQSEFVCVEVDVSMCDAVRNLDYTLNDDLLLSLTWEAPEDPTGLVEYQVYMDNEQLTTTNERQFISRTSLHHQHEVGDFTLFFFMY